MKFIAPALAATLLFSSLSFTTPAKAPVKKVAPKIQVAILLDVSNSMDGLIEQAKAQLWSMVNTLGRAQCTDKTVPSVELALYEYGRTSNDAAKGFVKQLCSFTNDLDSVSKLLFSLTTNGGDEYCGQVIYTSIDELKWDASSDSYKVIFIAGNEDFLQGKLHYTKACDKAKDKGIVVNTIYCGDYQRGIAEHWQLVGECGNGSFTNINQDAKEQYIPTPYDSTLMVLNSRLNGTYIGYGSKGADNISRQQQVDQLNFSAGAATGMKRVNAKAQSNVYDNGSWDLVDAVRADSTYFTKVDKKTLPDSLKNKTAAQLKVIVEQKQAERDAIQKQIITTNSNRDKYIATEKARLAATGNAETLETAVDKTIREQVKRVNMEIRKD